MNRELRERLLLPVSVPVISALTIAVAVFLFSRVLLAAPKEVSVAVALMMAVNILVVCAMIAAPPFGLRPSLPLLLGIAMFPVILGLAATTEVAGTPGEGHRAPAGPQIVEIAAAGLAFDKTQIVAEAGRKILVQFDNREAQSHNIGIFAGPDASSAKVFTGEIIIGPDEIEYQVGALEPGSHFFRCDVHPAQMTGTIVAEEKAGEPPAASGPALESLAADKLLFSETELSFPSDVAIELDFDNKEAQFHNVAIFEGSDATGAKIFSGELVTGPRKVRYKIPPLAEGAYFFQCDVHPATMKGTIRAG